MKRKAGFCWVKTHGGEFTVAKWYDQFQEWTIPGFQGTWLDHNFSEIGERIPAPDEVQA